MAVSIAGLDLNANSNRLFDVYAQSVDPTGYGTPINLVKCNVSHWGGVPEVLQHNDALQM